MSSTPVPRASCSSQSDSSIPCASKSAIQGDDAFDKSAETLTLMNNSAAAQSNIETSQQSLRGSKNPKSKKKTKERLLSITKSSEESKTVQLLKILFPDEDLINKFADVRKKFQADQSSYKEEYGQICAKVQVKLNLLEMNLTGVLQKPTSRENKDDSELKLKYTRCLQKCL
ncbi:uncharacterized protein [Clytia hemisphaerica]|uniref:uncharacterized protein n=1 Tax=Clytia hemisphaerica TaxID=252671 RepID=UPI0034D63BD8